jgi:hypothetical protein
MGLKYSEKIRYFACPSIAGLPPWKGPAGSNSAVFENGITALMHDPSQKLSYCWLASARWGTPAGSVGTLTPTPPAYEMSARTGIGNVASTALPSLAPIPDHIGQLGNAFAAQSLSELDGEAILRRQRSVNRNTLGSTSGMTLVGSNSSPPPLLRSPVVISANPMLHPVIHGTSPTMTNGNISAVKTRSGDLFVGDPALTKELTGGTTETPAPVPGGYSIMPQVTRSPPLANRNTYMGHSHYYQNPQQYHHMGRPDVPVRSPEREKADPYLPENGIVVQRDVEVLSQYGHRT